MRGGGQCIPWSDRWGVEMCLMEKTGKRQGKSTEGEKIRREWKQGEAVTLWWNENEYLLIYRNCSVTLDRLDSLLPWLSCHAVPVHFSRELGLQSLRGCHLSQSPTGLWIICACLKARTAECVSSAVTAGLMLQLSWRPNGRVSAPKKAPEQLSPRFPKKERRPQLCCSQGWG